MARASVTPFPATFLLPSDSFSVLLENAPQNSNSTSFGLAARSINTSGSDGVGPTPNSWGIICSFGDGSNSPTRVVASGRQVATWRMLRQGDVLRAQYLPSGILHISLNHMECEHRFDLPPEVVAHFGTPDSETFSFAMTLASDHLVRILD